jgi:hypothetical protein
MGFIRTGAVVIGVRFPGLWLQRALQNPRRADISGTELEAIFPPFDFSEVFFLEMCMLDVRRAAVKAYRFRGRLRNL